MELFLFLYTKRMRASFSPLKSMRFASRCAYICLSGILAALFSFVYMKVKTNQLPISITPSNIISTLSTVLIAIPVCSKLFPSVSFKESLFPNNIPLRKWERALLDLCLSFSSEISSINCLVIVGTFLTLSHCTIYEGCILFQSFIFGRLLSENIINVISWRRKKYTLTLLAAVALIAGLKQSRFFTNNEMQISLIAGIILLLILYIVFYNPGAGLSTPSPTILHNRFFKSYQLIYSKIILNNGNFKTSSAIILLIQFAFFIAFATNNPMTREQGKPFINQPVSFLILSPITFNNYVYNNIFGCFPSLGLNMLISSQDLKGMAKVYIKMSVVPIILDSIYCAILLSVLNPIPIKRLASLFVTSFVCIIIGFVSSTVSLKKIDFEAPVLLQRKTSSPVFGIPLMLTAFVQAWLYSLGDIYVLFWNIFVSLLAIAALFITCNNENKILSRFKSSFFNS